MSLLVLAPLSVYSILLLWLAWIDWKTTYLPLTGLIALVGLAVVTVLMLDAPLIPHLIGGGIGLFTAIAIRTLLSFAKQQESLGEADVWLLTSAGLLVGMQWIGPLIGLSTLLALLAYPIAKRQDANTPILPFFPFLASATLPIAWGLHLQWLAPTFL